MPGSTSSPERFDRLRDENPDLILNLYAMEPGGLVTLEIITPDAATYVFRGATAAEAMHLAFPSADEPTTETDIFS